MDNNYFKKTLAIIQLKHSYNEGTNIDKDS
jgi:hypothetical protein